MNKKPYVSYYTSIFWIISLTLFELFDVPSLLNQLTLEKSFIEEIKNYDFQSLC